MYQVPSWRLLLIVGVPLSGWSHVVGVQRGHEVIVKLSLQDVKLLQFKRLLLDEPDRLWGFCSIVPSIFHAHHTIVVANILWEARSGMQARAARQARTVK